jgi:hypothetical protein
MKIFFKIPLYYLFRYILFYLALAVKNNDYYFFTLSNMKDTWYWWIFLSLPVVMATLFGLPIYFTLRVRSSSVFLVSLSLIFAAEYLLYTYLASQTDLMNGVYNTIIGLTVFIIYFFKPLRQLFLKKPDNERLLNGFLED